jgi:hypothetical protein
MCRQVDTTIAMSNLGTGARRAFSNSFGAQKIRTSVMFRCIGRNMSGSAFQCCDPPPSPKQGSLRRVVVAELRSLAGAVRFGRSIAPKPGTPDRSPMWRIRGQIRPIGNLKQKQPLAITT